MSIELVMPSNYLILCHSLLLLPSVFPSITVFSNESALHMRWPKYWSFSFNISPSSDHPGLISFRMDWLDLLAVQGTLKSHQHQSSKASILLRSAFFIVQLSHPYMKQCSCPSMVEQIKKIWYSRTGTIIQPLKEKKVRACHMRLHGGILRALCEISQRKTNNI